ncbi:MAG: hypothetical protein JETT_0072 [Candidatus Jettenia ecosi]|uniref:Uncharacterized protein n=1 Tax=Candidatus Jettenia ecosi TaxID=2494326 RepID=A0A533QLG0_9BACT|nr:MAG: hypothetical protein JETT_0072 [Candidatus Jettenia ecosi]
MKLFRFHASDFVSPGSFGLGVKKIGRLGEEEKITMCFLLSYS